jgi:hypothetical protein
MDGRDLFGPLSISGSENKRSTGEAWGVIIVCTSISLAHAHAHTHAHAHGVLLDGCKEIYGFAQGPKEVPRGLRGLSWSQTLSRWRHWTGQPSMRRPRKWVLSGMSSRRKDNTTTARRETDRPAEEVPGEHHGQPPVHAGGAQHGVGGSHTDGEQQTDSKEHG